MEGRRGVRKAVGASGSILGAEKHQKKGSAHQLQANQTNISKIVVKKCS